MAESPHGGTVLELKNVTKRFGPIAAVDRVSITVRAGEVRAFMGENGAGKSTLCNLITGIHAPDEGEIFFDGKRVQFRHASQALAAGIRMVYQERNLIPYLKGYQCICLGLEERKMGIFLNDKHNHEVAEKVKADVGAHVPLDVEISSLTPAQQQMIEILRALSNESKLLILDEPTASLGREDTVILFNVIRKLKAQGVAVIIITHKLDEMYEIADTISIFRNGQHIITDSKDNITRDQAVTHMLGRELTSQYCEVVPHHTEDLALELKNFTDYKGKLNGVNMKFRKGEVVGLFGLVGVGRTELVRSIYGIYPPRGGEILLNGETVRPGFKAKDMIRRGVLLIPEERRKSGLFTDYLNIKENLTLGSMYKLSRLGFLNGAKERELVDMMTAFKSLNLKFHNLNQNVLELSGGNQQKVVIGRWIFHDNMNILIMDEPTQGIDVGVKHDIYVLVRDLAKTGTTVIISSSDLPEITGITDRIYVLKDGGVVAELDREHYDNHKILEAVL